jgi:hypothetical protein
MADVSRFEREEIEARNLPPALGTATEGLRSTIEAEVAKIVETAQARATEIEDRALEKANRFEQGSDRRASEVFEGSRARVAQMLAQIDAAEAAVRETVRSLRAEAERITDDLNRAGTEPIELTEPEPEPPPVEPVDEVTAAAEAAPAPEAEAPVEEPAPEAEAQPENASIDTGDPAVRELIRQQLSGFAESGRTRADAERMLLRFREGEQYFDLLDEIYPDETPGRRGLLRRRKAR